MYHRPHISYTLENTGVIFRFMQVIAESRQTGRTTNELNRYLNAETHGLFAVVKHLRNVTFRVMAKLFIAGFVRSSFVEDEGETIDKTPQVTGIRKQPEPRPESRPESRLESQLESNLGSKIILILRKSEQGKSDMASEQGIKRYPVNSINRSRDYRGSA